MKDARLCSAFHSTPHSKVSFWLNGGASGRTARLQVYGLAQIGSLQNVGQASASLGPLPTNSWQRFPLPLLALGFANKRHATGIVVQDRIGAVQPTFYVDDIQFDARPVPARTSWSVSMPRKHFAPWLSGILV